MRLGSVTVCSQPTRPPASSLYEEQDPSYHEISAAIRLGHKYKVKEWYSQSLKYLKRHFPTALDDWIAKDHYGPPCWEVDDELGAVNLGRRTGELSILPSAFISCICVGSYDSDALGIAWNLLRRRVPGAFVARRPHRLLERQDQPPHRYRHHRLSHLQAGGLRRLQDGVCVQEGVSRRTGWPRGGRRTSSERQSLRRLRELCGGRKACRVPVLHDHG